MIKEKKIIYKILSCNNDVVTLQTSNKATLFTLNWNEFLLPEYLCGTSKDQIFFLGTYYTHNMRNMDLTSKLSRDFEVINVKKLILSELRGGTYLILDTKTNKLETISIKFILSNLQLLNDFTSIQCFFLGIRAGAYYDKSNTKLT